jgi:hypothetical protein
MELGAEPLRSDWKGWLGGAPIPDDRRDLASQISTLIVFDFITGNWDRWSGGNIGYDAATGLLLFIDNDGAFYDSPPPGPLASQREKLKAVTRFSKSFVDKLRALDSKTLDEAMGQETVGATTLPLLSEKARAGVLARKDGALAIIDGRIRQAGKGATLFFP